MFDWKFYRSTDEMVRLSCLSIVSVVSHDAMTAVGVLGVQDFLRFLIQELTLVEFNITLAFTL